MFWLKFIAKFFKALRAGASPAQVAAGFALGFAIGLMPFFTLQGLILWLVLFIFNVNLAAAFVAMMLAGLIAFLLDPVFHELGFYFLVHLTPLQTIWETIYNLPVAPLTRFYNTVVMGSLISAAILLAPVYFAMKRFTIFYRETVEAKVQKWKIVQALKGSSFYRWVDKIQRLGDI